MKVVLLSTRRLPPTYFDTVKADLGGRPDLGLDVVGWVAPGGPVDGLVDSFTLIGPGRMPVATEPTVAGAAPAAESDAVPAPVGEAAKAPAPEAVTDADAAAEASSVPETVIEADPAASDAAKAEGAAAAAGAAAPTAGPTVAAKPRPTGAKRVVKAVQWRYRRLRKAGGRVVPASVKRSAPVKLLTTGRRNQDLAKTYWARILSRPDVQSTIDQADVVIALDGGAIWAGWQLGQRKPGTPVVLGVPAARRELDRLVGAERG